MELREALMQISEIRRQIARTEVFRGYRSVPVAFSGLLAVAFAGFQSVSIPDPLADFWAYLTLWVSAAAISVLATATEMAISHRRSTSPVRWELIWLSVTQFVPCVVAGGLVTVVLANCAGESVWMLPGLWQILFSLGIFASCRLLPRAVFGCAVFYMIAGIYCLVFARDQAALSPWAMGIPFGLGQLYLAAVLYWYLERTDGEQ